MGQESTCIISSIKATKWLRQGHTQQMDCWYVSGSEDTIIIFLIFFVLFVVKIPIWYLIVSQPLLLNSGNAAGLPRLAQFNL